jgi:hypothetical protein
MFKTKRAKKDEYGRTRRGNRGILGRHHLAGGCPLDGLDDGRCIVGPHSGARREPASPRGASGTETVRGRSLEATPPQLARRRSVRNQCGHRLLADAAPIDAMGTRATAASVTSTRDGTWVRVRESSTCVVNTVGAGSRRKRDPASEREHYVHESGRRLSVHRAARRRDARGSR